MKIENVIHVGIVSCLPILFSASIAKADSSCAAKMAPMEADAKSCLQIPNVVLRAQCKEKISHDIYFAPGMASCGGAASEMMAAINRDEKTKYGPNAVLMGKSEKPECLSMFNTFTIQRMNCITSCKVHPRAHCVTECADQLNASQSTTDMIDKCGLGMSRGLQALTIMEKQHYPNSPPYVFESGISVSGPMRADTGASAFTGH